MITHNIPLQHTYCNLHTGVRTIHYEHLIQQKISTTLLFAVMSFCHFTSENKLLLLLVLFNHFVSASTQLFKVPMKVNEHDVSFVVNLLPLCKKQVSYIDIATNAALLRKTAKQFCDTHLLNESNCQQIVKATGRMFETERSKCSETWTNRDNYLTVPLPTSFGFDIFVHNTNVEGTLVSQRVYDSGVWEPTKSRVMWQRFMHATHSLKRMKRTRQITSAATTSLQKLVLLDVGAHIGWYSLLVSSTGNRVINFEPSAVNIERIKASLEVNGVSDLVEMHSYGVGEVEKQGCHSWVEGTISDPKENNQAGEQEQGNQQQCGRGKTNIHVTTIDSVLKPDTQIFAMKVDTEGFETLVFRGARKLFSDPNRSPCVIQLEYMPERAPPNKEQQYELFANLTLLHGYTAYWAPEPWETHAQVGVPVTLANLSTALIGCHDFEFIRRDGRCGELLAKPLLIHEDINENINENLNVDKSDGFGISYNFLDGSMVTRQFVPYNQVKDVDPKKLAKDYMILHGRHDQTSEEIFNSIVRALENKLEKYKTDWEAS